MTEGGDAFVSGLDGYGSQPVVEGRYVRYVVDVVEGRFAGETVDTAVAVEELRRWPLVPPHWLYMPDHVTFAKTNTQPCGLPGWTGHSRKIVGWGNDPDPIAGWLAHVRGVLGEAA